MTDQNHAPTLEDAPASITWDEIENRIAQEYKRGTELTAAEAVKLLRRSERGAEALAAFWEMIDETGYSLDLQNWGALQALCKHMATQPDAFPELQRLINP